MTYTKTKSILDSAQIFFWVLILSVPAIGSYLNTFDLGRSLQVLRGNVTIMLPAVITYFVNYLFLVPKCLQRNGRKPADSRDDCRQHNRKDKQDTCTG